MDRGVCNFIHLRTSAACSPKPSVNTSASSPPIVTQAALDNFGRIDVWVNNAAVSQFGR
jgi:hypothetical protein